MSQRSLPNWRSPEEVLKTRDLNLPVCDDINSRKYANLRIAFEAERAQNIELRSMVEILERSNDVGVTKRLQDTIHDLRLQVHHHEWK